MQSVKIKCPAKINLDLRITGRRPDGFHNLDSVMQTVSLYDYLTINVENSNENQIVLNGNSTEIPYDKTNLVHKALELYLETTGITSQKISVYIEKNIPVAAGLAGGSTDGAGILFGINKIFDEKLTEKELHQLCAKLGSDLNLCLKGGRARATSRGEILEPLPFEPFNINLIKPINLGISAKEAYTAYAEKIQSPNAEIEKKQFKNDLEWAIINKYPQLQQIRQKYPSAIMTGSGSTYFSLEEEFAPQEGYWIKNGLKAIDFGVTLC